MATPSNTNTNKTRYSAPRYTPRQESGTVMSLTDAQIRAFWEYLVWLDQQPRHASYDRPDWFGDRHLKAQRDEIVFYSSGWGWRLRKGWRQTFAQRFNRDTEVT